MYLRAVRFALALTAIAAIFMPFSPFAVAATTGVLSGTVTDATTHAPIANVRVNAVAPTGRYAATTDVRGFYSIAGVYADTYTVSFEGNGYVPAAIPGVSVFADQTRNTDISLQRSLKTIASVTAVSRSSGAYQPTQTTDTFTVGTAQIQNIQGSSFNESETNLITSLPGAYLDSSGFPSIHGGRENEEGFQFEGIPYTEAYTNQFANTLALPGYGIASAQLTPGAGNASIESNGTGTLNIVAKRGTFPGYSDLAIGAGGPAFTHALNADFSTADPTGRWSEYAAFSGSNNFFKYGSGQFPATQTLNYFSLSSEIDREFLNNFIYRFGQGNRQSVQFFYDAAEHDFYSGYGGLQGLCFQSCNPFFTNFYGGLFGLSTAQLQAISPLYPFQRNVNETLSQAGRYPQTNYQPNAALKVQYSNNLNSSTYFSLTFYKVNSVTVFDVPNGGPSAIGIGDTYNTQGGLTTGGTLSLTKQLNSRNLLQFGADYGWLHPVDSFASLGVTFLGAAIFDPSVPYDFISPNDPNCPLGPGGCGYAYSAFPNASQLKIPMFDQQAIANRQDISFYLNDKVDFSERLKGEFGVRVDEANYHVPAPGIDPTTCTTQYLPAKWTAPTTFDDAHGFVCNAKASFSVSNDEVHPRVPQPRVGLSYRIGENTAVRLTYDRTVFFPVLGTYNASVPPGYYAAYNGIPSFNSFTGTPATTCGIAGFQVECRNFGEQLLWLNQNNDGVPIQPTRPETSNNYQITLQHQFTRGLLGGVALSLSPWYRRQYDTTALVASPVIGANGQPEIQNGQVLTNPTVAVNVGKEFASGVDFSITKGGNYGWSGLFTASYVNEFSSVIPTTGNEDFFPQIPAASVQLGNLYRVGFLSPFQSTLAVSYRTHSGIRINPRLTYNVGYPISVGTLTSAFINGVPFNVPNSNALAGSSASQAGIGANCYVDPQNPGSAFNPNCAAFRGTPEASSAGGKLSHPSAFLDLSLEYAPDSSRYSVGVDMSNLFNQLYSGPAVNARFQPLATGIGGPLTGFSVVPSSYTTSFATPQYLPIVHGGEPFINAPNAVGRTFFVYFRVKL